MKNDLLLILLGQFETAYYGRTIPRCVGFRYKGCSAAPVKTHCQTPPLSRQRIFLAYGIFIAGLVTSVWVSSTGQVMSWEHLIISDLLSPIDNPQGYPLAVGATAGSAILLLPVPGVLRVGAAGARASWTVVASWLYRIGLLASILVAITTPLMAAYDPFHIHLALLAFTGMTAGLAIAQLAAAHPRRPQGIQSAVLGGLHVAALLFLALVLIVPDFFHGRRWFLGLCEWLLVALIGASTIGAARVARG